MLSELEKLSLTLDTLTKSEAERIINAINKVLINLLNPHIIDLIWKEETASFCGPLFQAMTPAGGVAPSLTKSGKA